MNIPMTPRLKSLWETCSAAFAVAGYPPILKSEDDLWEGHVRTFLLDRLYAAGWSVTEYWHATTQDLAAAVARAYGRQARR